MTMARPLQSRAPEPPGATSGDAADGGRAAPVGTRAEALRRLQMGAIGVVAVLLLIGLASIVKDRATQTENSVVVGAAPTTAPQTSTTSADPLAEAGVVPDMPASPTATAPAPGPSLTTAPPSDGP